MRATRGPQFQVVPVRWARGAKRCMLDSDPMPHLPASAAASRALGESWCCAMTSAPASRRLWAACFSLGGSYHVPVQTTLTTALGFTAWTPRAKALTPATTVVMGCAATKPMMLVFVMEPATSPVRYHPFQSRPYTSETFGASPTAGPMPTKVTWGCCFATAFGYQNFTLDVAKQHPQVTFVGIGPAVGLAPNVSDVYGRLWEGRYLTGLVAGSMTKTNIIGFVAAHPITTVVAGVNAFALGVHAVNPRAVVKVVWTGTWYDPPKEKQAAQSLLDAGADVIAQHQDSPSALLAAAEAGKWGIGSESNMQRFAPRAYLTGTTWNWGPLVARIVTEARVHRWASQDYYGGLADGVVGLGPMNPAVPASVRAKVDAARRAIEQGTLHLFSGPLRDQAGTVRVPAGHAMSLKEILGFDWLVQGVQGRSPK